MLSVLLDLILTTSLLQCWMYGKWETFDSGSYNNFGIPFYYSDSTQHSNRFESNLFLTEIHKLVYGPNIERSAEDPSPSQDGSSRLQPHTNWCMVLMQTIAADPSPHSSNV